MCSVARGSPGLYSAGPAQRRGAAGAAGPGSSAGTTLRAGEVQALPACTASRREQPQAASESCGHGRRSGACQRKFSEGCSGHVTRLQWARDSMAGCRYASRGRPARPAGKRTRLGKRTCRPGRPDARRDGRPLSEHPPPVPRAYQHSRGGRRARFADPGPLGLAGPGPDRPVSSPGSRRGRRCARRDQLRAARCSRGCFGPPGPSLDAHATAAAMLVRTCASPTGVLGRGCRRTCGRITQDRKMQLEREGLGACDGSELCKTQSSRKVYKEFADAE